MSSAEMAVSTQNHFQGDELHSEHSWRKELEINQAAAIPSRLVVAFLE
jgi:hypothetical protein